VWRYRAHEANAYIGDDWRLNKHLRANFGIHASLFNIEGKTHTALSPRLSLRYRIREDIAVKGGYSRTTQYIHQLDKSYISLPTDQWVPITNNFKPQTCDKVFAGGYWNINKYYTLSVEAYYKWLNNLVDYYDTYYLLPTQMAWDKRLTSGKGTAKGVDIKVSKDIGRITGQLSYSLMWADRTFEGKNNGKTFPARFDTRHKINALVMYHINDIWELNASWTGQSGNMYTLSTQSWDNSTDLLFVVNVNQGINNYRLPFYHRLDLGITRHTNRGYWTISLYNAYCNMNVVALRYGYSTDGRPKFQKLHLIPIIPSFTYTWLF
jgi:outer membrane receptor for ferrienterochelin and colicin